MACGVTKVITGAGTVTCDNAGTSSHTGQHAGLISFSFRDFSIASGRVWWLAADTVPGLQAAIVRGTAF